jgi:zinc transport system substrate-binding protein
MRKDVTFAIILVCIAAVLFMLVSRYSVIPPRDWKKLQVTASFYPLYFFAQQIGGDKAEVVNMTPAGAEPHEYELTPQDLARIENSRLLILNGNGLEPWGENIKENTDPSRTLLVVAGEGLAGKKISENGSEIIDPHVWLSPPLAEKMTEKILAGFVSVDPKNKNYYETQAANLRSRLADLDQEFRAGLSNCARRDIITSHAAFGYLAAAYDLRQVAIAGLSPDAEPSSQALSSIADFSRTHDVNYIFFESLVSSKLAVTLAQEIGAKTLTLNPLEGLTDKEIAAGENYFTVMKSNLANLKIALQCSI